MLPDGVTTIEQWMVRRSSFNLLDNWYFVDPINQRNLLTYQTGANQYTIDRWSAESWENGLKVTVEPNGVLLENTTENEPVQFKQILEGNTIKPGTDYTFSIAAKDVSGDIHIYLTKAEEPWTGSSQAACSGVSSLTYSFVEDNYTGMYKVYVLLAPGASVKLVAAKLELGPSQTLAHKEGDVWVLNDPPPNKALELEKCQRYYIKTQLSRQLCFISNLNDECIAWIPVKLPVAMRVNRPTIVNFAINPWISHSGAIYDTKGTNIKSVSVNADGAIEKDGNIGFVVFFEEDLQNYVNGSIGCIGYLNLELDANL